MITQEEARLRVQRGAAHLDKVRPGWFNQIDIGTLTLHDPCGCIVGQLCGHAAWEKAAKIFELSEQGLRLCGFNLITFLGDPPLDQSLSHDLAMRKNYAPLQDAWIEAICDRRLAAETPAPELTREAEHTV